MQEVDWFADVAIIVSSATIVYISKGTHQKCSTKYKQPSVLTEI